MKVKATNIAIGSLTDGKEYEIVKKGDSAAIIVNDLGKEIHIKLEGQCPTLRPDSHWTLIRDSIDDATPEEWAALLYKEVVPELDSNEEVSSNEEVNSPQHYNTGAVECIEAISSTLSGEEFQGYCRGNALKYLWRCMYKGKTKQDLEKCRWYLERLLSTL